MSNLETRQTRKLERIQNETILQVIRNFQRKKVRFKGIQQCDLNLFEIRSAHQCVCCEKIHFEIRQVNGNDFCVATAAELEVVRG